MFDTVEDVAKGPRFQGKREYLAYLQGEHITHKERILAMCYYCSGHYADGFLDCKNNSCPLYGVVKGRK